MDIVAHALWTAAAGIPVRRRLHRPLNLGWLVFWGIFPDIFTFAVPAVVRLWWYATGVNPHLLPDANSPKHFEFAWQLYYCSHSLVIFAFVFGMIWFLRRLMVLELAGWGLHILIDIPTHQGIFALQFLWPLSHVGISGVRWENPRFLAVNYCALVLVYAWIWATERRRGRYQTSLQRLGPTRTSAPQSDSAAMPSEQGRSPRQFRPSPES